MLISAIASTVNAEDDCSSFAEDSNAWIVKARRSAFLTVCGGARCAEAATAPPGAYDLRVPLFDRAVAPDSGVAPVITVEAAFGISSEGTGDADIEIPIGL